MMSIYVILTALATTVAQGSVECSFSAATGDQQCSGAVGQLLFFRLPYAANTQMKLVKDKKYKILQINPKKQLTLNEDFVNQPVLFANGTLKLGKAMKKHSGEYVMEEFALDGALLKKVKVNVQIKAPVSKPNISQVCLTPEQIIIICSAEGDEAKFTLTLDGFVLMETRDLMQDGTVTSQSAALASDKHDELGVSDVTVSLHGQRTGNLMCTVSNHVSREETVIHLSCKDVASPFLVGAVAVIAILAIVLVALSCVFIHSKYKLRTTAANEVVPDNPREEVVYSDVRPIARPIPP